MPAGGSGDDRPGVEPPRFDRPVPRDGYAWWYVDALSEDGRFGITLIAFVGSVFSPYYARARGRGAGDPEHHCALNIALHGPGANRWAMTERGRGALRRDGASLAIGPSSLAWDGAALTVRIDETTMPVPSRLRGTVRVHPAALVAQGFALDAAGRHRWRPIAPRARVEVALTHPSLSWSGPGYCDSNAGDTPLEDEFARWTWSRAPLRSDTAILYDVVRRDGSRFGLSLGIGPDGAIEHREAPPACALPGTRWRIGRATRADAGHRASVRQTVLDAPFYARSVLRTRLFGEDATAMHESLSLDRFRAPWVRLLLPFRMPRAAG